MAELPLIGEEFAGYRLVSVLGRGGMSIVFRAENPRLGNVIALKVLDPALAGDDVSAPGSLRSRGSPPR